MEKGLFKGQCLSGTLKHPFCHRKATKESFPKGSNLAPLCVVKQAIASPTREFLSVAEK
jgi:hypothetical protein